MSTAEISKEHIVIAAHQIARLAASPTRNEKLPPALNELACSGVGHNDVARMIATVIRTLNVEAIDQAYSGSHTPTEDMGFTDTDLDALQPDTSPLGLGYSAKVMERIHYHLDGTQHPLLRDDNTCALKIMGEALDKQIQAEQLIQLGVSPVPDMKKAHAAMPLLKQNGHILLGAEAGLRTLMQSLEMDGDRLVFGGEVLSALLNQHNNEYKVLPAPFESGPAAPASLAVFKRYSQEASLPDAQRHDWPEMADAITVLVAVEAVRERLQHTDTKLFGLDGEPFSPGDKKHYIDSLGRLESSLRAAVVGPQKALQIDFAFPDAVNAHRAEHAPSTPLYVLTKDPEHAAKPLPESTPVKGALRARTDEPGVVVLTDKAQAEAAAQEFGLGLAEHYVSANTLNRDFYNLNEDRPDTARLKAGLLALYEPATEEQGVVNTALAFAKQMGYERDGGHGEILQEALVEHWEQPGLVEHAKHEYVAKAAIEDLNAALDVEPEPLRPTYR